MLYVNFADPANELKKRTDQIRKTAAENQVGLAESYQAFEFLYTTKKNSANTCRRLIIQANWGMN